ncbi:hypothetical protein CBS101457_003798 [Exobasidium rhododendri]|nr:hypothetical protein CBS101457_003798 [Exobasidium rhododendri]
MPPQRARTQGKVVRTEDVEASTSQRPSRARLAPERYTSSTLAPRTRPSKRGAASVKSALRRGVGERLEDCRLEESFVRDYGYDHVGQAAHQEDSNVWVEVPALSARLVKASGQAELDQNTREEEAEEEEVQTALDMRREAPVKAIINKEHDMIAKGGERKGVGVEEEGEKEMEEEEEEDQRPTQDSVEIDIEDSDEADRVKESGPSTADSVRPDEGRHNSAVVLQTAHVGFPTADHPPEISSTSPLANEEAKDTMAQSPARSKLKLPEHPLTVRRSNYHPETALSHDPEERTDVGTKSTHSESGCRPRAAEASTSSLFLGSDEEDGRVDRAKGHLLQVKQRQESLKRLHHNSEVDVDRQQVRPNKVSSIVEEEKSTSQQGPEPEVGSSSAQVDKGNQRDTRLIMRKDKKSSPKAKGGKPRAKSDKKAKRKEQARSREESSDDDDLAQNLNVDAFARSTSQKKHEAKRAKEIARLRRQRLRNERKRQGEASSSDAASASSSSSSSSDDDSDDSSEPKRSNFIVPDRVARKPIGKIIRKGEKIISKRKRSLSPPSLVSKDYLSDVRSLDRRDRLQEYIRSIIVTLVELDVGDERLARLEAVRTNLQAKFKSQYDSLTSQSNRRQFTWYLKHYPKFERRTMTSVERKQHIGCAACHRSTQKCEFAYTCWGHFYDPETFVIDSAYSSSELSSDAEDIKEEGKNERGEKTFTFYLGESCGKHASIKSKLHHWEFRVVSDMVKLPSYKALNKKDAKGQVIKTEDIEAVVDSYYPRFSTRCARLETEATQPDRIHRYRERWDD